ncbi:hypothetical protein Tco_0611845 [Tanacetum coccineum]
MHNMVAYLKKPEGSEGFHQIVDFLNASHIRYALTENPTIYVSHIEQFWYTATARTLDDGEQELTATVDGKVKTINKSSVRKHLKLADNDVTAAQVRNRSKFGIIKWYQSFALRNFDLEDMEHESTNSGPTTELPILKLGEYEMWAIRIKQYFQIQNYALWEVIENGDS